MTPVTRAVMNPLLVVFLLIIVMMWFFGIAPPAVSIAGVLICFAGLAFLAITKRREAEAKRHTRNHRRPGRSKA